MPRLVHKLPTYTRHKTGRARVRIHGKDHYLPGEYGSRESLKAYSELVDQILSGTADPQPTLATAPPDVLTIAELIDKYWDHAQAYYRRDGKLTGESETIRYALRPLLELFPSLLVSEFRPKHLKLVRGEIIQRGCSRTYVNACIRRVRRMFRWGVSEELVRQDVVGALKEVESLKEGRSAAREKELPGPVEDADIEAILPHVSPIVRDIVQAMRLSGMRPGEALGMTVEVVDTTDPVCWLYRPRRHKTIHRGRQRVIHLGPRCQAILAPYFLKAGGSGPVFRFTWSGLHTAIRNACFKAGIKPWAPNQLRHSAASAIRKQFGLEAAQVILGHKHANTTEIYAEMNADRGREIARAIG
jgi:integrase